ncbi:DUF502 domain-containing protein [Aestuariibaculum suncheonense]|uniref:DUF502 domain-containing protein n=1 Tax=Aestuariibaculum suncheonense TaxID=1028745 RepID=A0A8J6Q584_9FLAO|nr:hypothetical protein [Aestuariibaculum suncheonense]MBD0834379.1 hypothetical protein [Aestuariibaculum suncheonense]
MAKFKTPSSSLIVGGLFFLTPVLFIILLGTKAIGLLTPLAVKITEAFGLHSVFGGAAVLIVCVLIIIAICVISGYFIQKGVFSKWSTNIEEKLFVHFPSIQILKYRMIGDQETVINEFWDAIILEEEKDRYNIAFITERSEKFITLFIPDAPRLDAGEVRYVPKGSITYYPITMKQAMSGLYSFGKGMHIESIITQK